MKKAGLVFIMMAIACGVIHAQDHELQKSWGVGAGALGYTGRYSVNADLSTKVSYNVNALYQQHIINNNVWVRANGVFGQLKGDNTSFENSRAAKGSFSTNMAELSVLAGLDIFDLSKKRFTPYVAAGVGAYSLLGYKASNGATKPNKDKTAFVVPVLGGVAFKATNKIAVFAEGNVRLLNKNLDNVYGTGVSNPNRYYSINIGARYSLNASDIVNKPIW
ncbi:MAG: hypothetical protein E6Q95_04675 [Chitinophagaceae bacterium]|nr:MAG: hypothetical protein E6Q95_04675 [Chitinophagaceae bacterium]